MRYTKRLLTLFPVPCSLFPTIKKLNSIANRLVLELKNVYKKNIVFFTILLFIISMSISPVMA